MSRFTEKKLIIASHNKGKIAEIDNLLKAYDVEVVEAPDFGLEEPEENGDSFLANSAIKAQFVAQQTGIAALADDSGLVVPALDGQPGIYSARWGGDEKDFTKAMQRVGDELDKRNVEKQGAEAYFICALTICLKNGELLQFEGRVDGNLTFPMRGGSGFGYDAIFIPKGYDKTFAEMGGTQKKALSHRSNAFAKMVNSGLF